MPVVVMPLAPEHPECDRAQLRGAELCQALLLTARVQLCQTEVQDLQVLQGHQSPVQCTPRAGK